MPISVRFRREPAPSLRRRGGPGTQAAGFTITEAVFALGLTLMVSAGFLLLFQQGRNSLNLQPELSSMRQDGRAALDRIAADLLRAGSGLPVEVPIFTDLDRAGNGDPDGLDFLAAPERLAEATFEAVVGFDGARATLGQPRSRLAGDGENPFVVVFNDDEMTPRWVFGRVVSIRDGTNGLMHLLSEEAHPAGAEVRVAPLDNRWHHHFHGSVDADTFSPGSGGGLIERGLQSVLGGVIEAALPALGSAELTGLTEQVVGKMIEELAARAGTPAPTGEDGEDIEDFGLFGLGQPGLVPVSRIRYWVRAPSADAADGRGVLMRRVDEGAAQPVGFVEDLQVRYVTGANGDVLLDTPPGFIGDMRTAARLADHIVRAVDISVRVRSLETRFAAAPGGGAGDPDLFLTRTYRRRIGLRVPAAGVERRAWEEIMQTRALPTEIPKIGPLRYLKLPW